MRRQGSLFLGLILIGLGALFLLGAMDIWPEDASTWPGILIVVGVAMAADQSFRREHVSWFGPIVLIGLGTFFLLRDFDIVESEFMWPAVLILAGLWLLSGAMRKGTVETSTIDVPLQGASRARVRVDHGGGELRIGSLAATSSSLCQGTVGAVEQRVNRSGDRLDVTLRQRHSSWMRSLGREFRLDFNPSTELELDMHTGATDSRLDLSDLLVSSLELKTGASSTFVSAPRRGHTRVAVDAGAASVEFRVPPGVAGRITADTGLADVSIDTNRFLPSGGGYESPDYSTSLNRLELRIKGGVASFKVR
jgi:LiaF transmembrane domain